ncbi:MULTISPECIES: DNA methyltransferase [Pseudomonas]|uniref:DNA methyltransferase n=1 Tax=Pseudomonas TaxID=286 RepID=UPI00026F5E0C|nr:MULTISPECIES: DNA methyltransferase [Pseudomonas]EJL97874.1 DNA modification methylase [Pseudomonas sp. GM102]NWD08950.1 DNA methylase N-4/N-6 [Pseudomonas gingeri]NWE34781.1 DNA methylase N-4/N-6 [Pseudomonas gingeri]NWE56882.1 DNA methylase N-4/N-6 [Pseudomonas gingeri]NWF02021.1 DNA methylase N-4/N-6 [Pseudomonas gingeri]
MSSFWANTLQDTVKNSERISRFPSRNRDAESWLMQYLESAPTSTNQGAAELPFQRWFHFKEAFSPKFVADTLSSLPYPVNTCLDPFSGSGTTAITCRMLGIESLGVEVNPFLADLIKSKLVRVPIAEFCKNYELLISNLEVLPEDEVLAAGMPVTFVEPGKNSRYIFSREIYGIARAILRASRSMDVDQSRLLRVLLGSVLVQNSNVVINGKGRRYRRNWQLRSKTGTDLIKSLDAAIDTAAADIARFSGLPESNFILHQGDARSALSLVMQADVAIFSPPYPNSFDYTDVYNVELWMLGYLESSVENRALRSQTLRSHVQTKWVSTISKVRSDSLDLAVAALEAKRGELWNVNIPEMIRFYFDDLWSIFFELKRILKVGHHAIVAIGDSQYAGVHIDVATILSECVEGLSFKLVQNEAMRSMRNSSQHGGSLSLSEHCLVFERVQG